MNIVGSLVDRVMFPGTQSSYDVSTFEELVLLPLFNAASSYYSKIPSIVLPYRRGSPYLLIYAHGNGTDLGSIISRLELLGNAIQSHIIAFDYPGYGCFKGKASVSVVDACLERVMEFVVRELHWPIQNVILYGCSIGTGPCTRYARNVALGLSESARSSDGNDISSKQLGGIILQCPYRSIRHAAERFIGTFMSRLLVDVRWNIEMEIKDVKCPILWIHGKKDELFDYKGSLQMYQDHPSLLKMIHLPENATHLIFDFEFDIVKPIRKFLQLLVLKNTYPFPPHFSTSLCLPSRRLARSLASCPIPVIASSSATIVIPTVADVISSWIPQKKLAAPFNNNRSPYCHSCLVSSGTTSVPKTYDQSASSDYFLMESANNESNSDEGWEEEVVRDLGKYQSPHMNHIDLTTVKNMSILQKRMHDNAPYNLTLRHSSSEPAPQTDLKGFSATQQRIQPNDWMNSERLPVINSQNRIHAPSSCILSEDRVAKSALPHVYRRRHPIRRQSSGSTASKSSNASTFVLPNLQPTNSERTISETLKTSLLSSLRSLTSNCNFSSSLEHLYSMKSLYPFLRRSIEILAHAMREEAVASGLQCSINDHFIDVVYWVRRYYSVRFRHCFGADLVYRKKKEPAHKPHNNECSLEDVDQSDSFPSWELYGLCIAGVFLRLSAMPIRGCLHVDRVPTVLGRRSNTRAPPRMTTVTTTATSTSSVKNCPDGHNMPESGSPNYVNWGCPLSTGDLDEIYSSLEYMIFPIYTPSKDFLFSLARWLVLSLGTKSVRPKTPPTSSWLTGKSNASFKNSQSMKTADPNCCDGCHHYSNKESGDISRSFTLDSNTTYSYDQQPKWDSEFDVSSECLDDLQEFAKSFTSDFCSQLRRPAVERIPSQLGNYFCFGWDYLLRKLFDDWAWIEPRVTLTHSYYLHPDADQYRPLFSKRPENVVVPKATTTLRVRGWKTYRCWLFDEGFRILEEPLQKGTFESPLYRSMAQEKLVDRPIIFQKQPSDTSNIMCLGISSDVKQYRSRCAVEHGTIDHSNGIQMYGNVPQYLRRSEVVDWAPFLLSALEKAGGLSVTVPHVLASTRASLGDVNNNNNNKDVELEKELNDVWDMRIQLSSLSRKYGYDSIQDHFAFNSSRMNLLLTHPAVYSLPRIELSTDRLIINIAKKWIKRLLFETKAHPSQLACRVRKEVLESERSAGQVFGLHHISPNIRSTSRESIYFRKPNQRSLYRDRRRYISDCKKYDQVDILVSTTDQSPKHQRWSICYHQAFHYVLLKPGIINSSLFSLLDSLWRLVELITGLECGPLDNPIRGEDTKVFSSEARSAIPSSAQAAFLVNLTYGLMLTRRLLNLVKSHVSVSTPSHSSLLHHNYKFHSIPELPPTIIEEYPGVVSPCVRFLDEIRFALLHKDHKSGKNWGDLGYSRYMKGWSTGCDFRSRHCRLAVELEDLLSLLLETLESLDMNSDPVEICCQTSMQLVSDGDELESQTLSGLVNDQSYKSEMIMIDRQDGKIRPTPVPFSDSKHSSYNKLQTRLDQCTFQLDSLNVKSALLKPFMTRYSFNTSSDSLISQELIQQSIPPCQHSFIRHVLLAGVCGRGVWWKDGFTWVNQPTSIPLRQRISLPILPSSTRKHQLGQCCTPIASTESLSPQQSQSSISRSPIRKSDIAGLSTKATSADQSPCLSTCLGKVTTNDPNIEFVGRESASQLPSHQESVARITMTSLVCDQPSSSDNVKLLASEESPRNAIPNVMKPLLHHQEERSITVPMPLAPSINYLRVNTFPSTGGTMISKASTCSNQESRESDDLFYSLSLEEAIIADGAECPSNLKSGERRQSRTSNILNRSRRHYDPIVFGEEKLKIGSSYYSQECRRYLTKLKKSNFSRYNSVRKCRATVIYH